MEVSALLRHPEVKRSVPFIEENVMNFIETFSCIMFTILSVACIVYMMKNDSRAKRLRIYERIEKVEVRVQFLEIAPLKGELEYWKAKMLEALESRAATWIDDDSPQAEKTFGIQKKETFGVCVC